MHIACGCSVSNVEVFSTSHGMNCVSMAVNCLLIVRLTKTNVNEYSGFVCGLKTVQVDLCLVSRHVTWIFLLSATCLD